jgi:putative aldouronate transport system permease protein
MVYKPTLGEKIFNVFNIIFMAFMIIVTLYPFWYCVTCSLSKDIVGNSASLMLWPKGLSFAAYASVITRPSIITGYKVTLIVVVVATTLNIIMTSIAAFLLTRRNFAIKGFLTWLMLFTMYFSGGMIPTYVIYANVLHLKDTYAVLILPGLINVYNMIVMRTNFAAIPVSLEESVKVDGGNDMHVLYHIILPLSKAIISVMVLYYGVAHWNSWFNAMLYINDPSKRPLQLELRTILLENQTGADGNAADNMGLAENIKFATILVATLPILAIYPFIQKYFVKGVMIGAVKG